MTASKLITSVCVVIAVCAQTGYGTAWTWTTLDYPGAIRTYANGIITGNSIVGSYADSSGQHGYIYDGDTWTTLNYPGTTSASIYGGSGSSVVGTYNDGSRNHGFLYDGETWTTLDRPNSTTTVPRGISGNNIVGGYSSSHGFLYDGTSWATIDLTLPP